MIIAQGSIGIDENAKLAEEAKDKAEFNGNALTIFKNDMSAYAQQLRADLNNAIKQNDATRDQIENAQNNISDEIARAKADGQSLAQSYTDQVGNTITTNIEKEITSQQSFLQGKMTTSESSPFDADVDPSVKHQNGDVWIQISQTNRDNKIDYDVKGNVIKSAVAMFHYVQGPDDPKGGWVEQNWDQEIMSVENLSALSADLGDVSAGNMTGVHIVGGTLGIDINGGFGGGNDGGWNPLSWDNAGQKFNAYNWWGMGMHVQNGLMTLRGRRTSGTEDAGNYDTTMIGPNDIKLRESVNTGTGNGDITDRVDIRTNYIEIASKYGTPKANGTVGCGLYSDGTASISALLKVPKIEAGPPGQHLVINSSVDGRYAITSHVVGNDSNLSIKNVKGEFSNKRALAEILGTDIYNYTYKGDNQIRNIGPVIDDVHDIDKSQYNTSEYLIYHGDQHDSIALQNAVALLIGSVHELSEQNESLLSKITQLEMEKNGNN